MLICTVIGRHYNEEIRILVIGTPSEILMNGDIISFKGEVLGNCTYTTVLGSNITVPFLRVYAENLKVERFESL